MSNTPSPKPPERSLHVHLLPALTTPDALAGATVVVIDVLRATTTMIHALASGAKAIVPCLEVAEAQRVARELGTDVLLGGERGGEKIPGFDLGNSPAEYTAHVVAGKTLVFTTTNGTRALARAAQAARVLLGAFVNFSAICETLRGATSAHLLCAGTDGQITREDVLFAGAVVADLRGSGAWQVNDQALLACDAWQSAEHTLRTGSWLLARLRDSRGGRNLIEIGQERDIELAAQLDRFALVPMWDVATARVMAAG